MVMPEIPLVLFVGDRDVRASGDDLHRSTLPPVMRPGACQDVTDNRKDTGTERWS